jgi:hypothetical protein
MNIKTTYLGKSHIQSQAVSPTLPAGYTVKNVAGKMSNNICHTEFHPALLYQIQQRSRYAIAAMLEPMTTPNHPPRQ